MHQTRRSRYHLTTQPSLLLLGIVPARARVIVDVHIGRSSPVVVASAHVEAHEADRIASQPIALHHRRPPLERGAEGAGTRASTRHERKRGEDHTIVREGAAGVRTTD